MNSRHILGRVMLLICSMASTQLFWGRTISNNQRVWLSNWGISTIRVQSNLPKLIRWLPPPPGRFKLNVDGSFKCDVGAAGGGGVLRDSLGNLVWAFAAPYHNITSSLEAKALALRDGLSHCLDQHNHAIDVDSDSLVVVQASNRVFDYPWRLSLIMTNVFSLSYRVHLHISHVFREAN